MSIQIILWYTIPIVCPAAVSYTHLLILLVAAGVSAVTSIYSQEGLGKVAIILVVVLINAILGVYHCLLYTSRCV